VEVKTKVDSRRTQRDVRRRLEVAGEEKPGKLFYKE